MTLSSISKRARRWIDRVFDGSVDAAARDGKKTLVARLVATLLMSMIVAANVGLYHALLWTWLVLVGEYAVFLLYKRWFAGSEPAHTGARLSYVAGSLALCILWTSIPWAFWFANHPGLSAAAIVILSTQMIHTQAFAYRSIPALVATGVPPALAMLVMPWLAGPVDGVERVTFALIALLAMGYGWASIDAHRRTARLLERANNEPEHLAYFDALTSLANRRQFTEHLRRLINLSRRRGTRFALLLLDLDQFKLINDTLGHDAGDAMLVEIGARLRSAVRVRDDVARLGGDEFGILLSETDDHATISAICERISQLGAREINYNGRAMSTSLSVGVALFPGNGDREEDLYKSADLALYEAKRSGRNTWRYSTVNVSSV